MQNIPRILDAFSAFYDEAREFTNQSRTEPDSGKFVFTARPDDADFQARWDQLSRPWWSYKAGCVLNLNILLREFDLNYGKKPENILSVGSGIGLYEVFLGLLFQETRFHARIFCLDSSFGMNQRVIALTQKFGVRNVIPVQAQAPFLPFANDDVDHLICVDTIQWLLDWQPFLTEVSRVMSHKGQRKAFFTVHERPMAYFLNGQQVMINPLTPTNLEYELVSRQFQVTGPFEIHGGEPELRKIVGSLMVAKHSPRTNKK